MRSPRTPPPEQPAGPGDKDTLILSVKLASGRFETSMRFPFPATGEAFQKQLEAWHEMGQTGFRIGAKEMTATFRKKEGDTDV